MLICVLHENLQIFVIQEWTKDSMRIRIIDLSYKIKAC